MSKSASLKQKVVDAVEPVKKYWNKPPAGKYVSYKEMVTLGGAGFGVHWASLLATAIGLSADNLIIGHSIGIDGVHLQTMLVIANLVGVPIGLFRGWYFDNHSMKGGKFIPFLLRTPFPIVLISTVMVWLPYENWEYTFKCVVIWCMYMLLQFFLCFYMESFTFIQQIITPDAQERAKAMSVSQIIYSLAPTVTSFVIPTVAALTYGANNIWSYRLIYPVFTVIGLVINTVFFRKVKERFIIPKKKHETISLWFAFKEVAKNKYFWIVTVAGWIGFLENCYGVTMDWTFIYSNGGELEKYRGLANTIIGNAALWSMMLAPVVINKLGKRNLLIFSNIFNVFLISVLFFSFQNIWIVCVLMFINNFVNVFGNIYFPGINADMRDYHQWKTGVRIDGLFGTAGIISTFVGFGTGYVVPFIYRSMGLAKDYSVLYDDNTRNSLLRVLLICSIVGAVLNLIPYLFYDLTEVKHMGYIKVLKIRAMFDNYVSGVADDSEICEGVEIIKRAEELKDKKKLPFSNDELKKARSLPKRTAWEKQERAVSIKNAKQELRDIREYNEAVEYNTIILQELEKFESQRFIKKLELCRETVSVGRDMTVLNFEELFENAMGLKKDTLEQRQIRADAIKDVREKKKAAGVVLKHGKACLNAPDEKIKEQIERGESAGFFDEMKKRRQLKAFDKEYNIYLKATAPYFKAENFVRQAENYEKLDEVMALYDEIKAKG